MQICYIPPVKSKYNVVTTNKQKKVIATLSSAMTVCWYNANIYANEMNISGVKTKLNEVGMPLIDIAQLFIYWITLLCALIDIAKSVKKQDISGVVAIIIKYGSMMGAAYAMPWIWELIKGIFQ